MDQKTTPIDLTFLDCMRKGAFEMANAYLRLGADVNAVDRAHGSDTALHMAAKRGNLRAMDSLILAGADRAALDDWGRTPEDLARLIGCEMGARKLRPR